MNPAEKSDAIHIPEQCPLMVLPQTVFFPQVGMPLHIFEERYRIMLEEILDTHGMLCLVAADENQASDAIINDPPLDIGTIGLIRSSEKQEDGTSHILLHGIIRVRIQKILTETPYRLAAIEPIINIPGGNPQQLEQLQQNVKEHFQQYVTQFAPDNHPLVEQIQSIDEAAIVADVLAHVLPLPFQQKQKLLEQNQVSLRLESIQYFLKQELKMKDWLNPPTDLSGN